MAKLADSDVRGSTSSGVKNQSNTKYELTQAQILIGALVLFLMV